MVHPHTTPSQLDAFVRSLAADQGAFGIRFVCSRGPRPESAAGWFDLAIPCVGMLRAGWILAPLLAGAAEVTVADCTCGVEDDVAGRTAAALTAAREVLAAAGVSPRRIPEAPIPIGRGPLVSEAPGSGFEPFGLMNAAAALGVTTFRGPLVDAGSVRIDESSCTGCEMCSTVCPSRALSSQAVDGGLSIAFEALRCTGCGECVRTCPEAGAIELDRVLDGAAVGREPSTLVLHALARCTRCGAAVATETVLERLAERLDDDVVIRQISSLCLDCRGTTMVF
jgi:ferredoxin